MLDLDPMHSSAKATVDRGNFLQLGLAALLLRR
jgi:hypothetical protein